MDVHPHPIEMPSTALSKEVQDSLLKAHFPTPTSGLFTDPTHDPMPYHRGTPRPTATNHSAVEGGHEVLRKVGQKGSRRGGQARGPQVVEQMEGIHEITRVTNSVQAPISAFTPLPREGEQEGRGQSGGVGFDNVR